MNDAKIHVTSAAGMKKIDFDYFINDYNIGNNIWDYSANMNPGTTLIFAIRTGI